jgi:hypothetical protein
MFLLHKPTDVLVEVLSLDSLFDPCHSEIIGQSHRGQELQDPSSFMKAELAFPSGEVLPLCWLNPRYREREIRSRLQEPTLICS